MLTVRNMEGNPTLFQKGDITVQWQMAGDALGEDVQQVPDRIGEDIDFIRSCARGVLKVENSDDEAVMERVAKQASMFATQRATQDAQVLSVLSRPQDNQILTLECIAPTGQGTCALPVVVRKSQADQVPPLCSRHKTLQTSFVASDEGSAGDVAEGPVTKWHYSGL